MTPLQEKEARVILTGMIDASDVPSARLDDRTSTKPPSLTSMFSLLSHPEPERSLPGTPSSASPSGRVPSAGPSKDIRAEVLEGIGEIIDELGQVDDQIAAYALDHIHSNEIILTHTSSTTVQKFLLKAAAKRKFTVIQAESYPNNHEETHATVSGARSNDDEILSTESFQKPLIAMGVTVILIPDSAVFALMSRVNKVILGTHSVLANGGLVAASGTRVIARAAKVHQTPVVVVSGVYKLSPVYPFDFESLIEYGDASKVIGYEDGDLVDQIDVQNPLYDYVPAELVDLYITNLWVSSSSSLHSLLEASITDFDLLSSLSQGWSCTILSLSYCVGSLSQGGYSLLEKEKKKKKQNGRESKTRERLLVAVCTLGCMLYVDIDDSMKRRYPRRHLIPLILHV